MAQYGCQGSVMQIAPEHRGRIQMNFIEPKEMDLSQVISDRASLTPAYYPGYRAAQRLGITPHLLSRITGSIFVLKGAKEAELESASKVNVGLNLKVLPYNFDYYVPTRIMLLDLDGSFEISE